TPLEANRPCGSRQLPIDHIEGGGLPRAIWADQCQQLAGLDIESDAIDRHIAAETTSQAAHLQQRLHRPIHVRLPARDQRANWPAIPCGNATTITRMTKPNKAPQYSVRPTK